MTPNPLDSMLAIVVAKLITDVLALDSEIVLRSVPQNVQYKSVKTKTNFLEGDFNYHRARAASPFTLCDESGNVYYNLWAGQQRGEYLDFGEMTARSVNQMVRKILRAHGCRKRFDICKYLRNLNVTVDESFAPTPKKDWVSLSRSICVLSGVIDAEQMNLIVSAYADYNFMVEGEQSDRKLKSLKFVTYFSEQKLKDAINLSMYVVTDDLIRLVPYSSVLRGKNIVVMSEKQHVAGLVLQGSNVKYLSDFLVDFTQYSRTIENKSY